MVAAINVCLLCYVSRQGAQTQDSIITRVLDALNLGHVRT